MCKGSFSTDNTEDYSPIEADMTLRSRRPHTAGSPSTRRTRSLSAHRRSYSVTGTAGKSIDDFQTDPAFAEALWQYYYRRIEKSQRPKLGLQQYRVREPSSRLLRQSGIYRNPALTRGQKLYLLEKCHIYDVNDSKIRHTNSYLQVLTKRFHADLPAYRLDSLYKPEFRLNNPQDYFNYVKFVKTPRPTVRPLNTGYFTSKQVHHPRVPIGPKKQPSTHRSHSVLDRKDFVTTSDAPFANEKLPRVSTACVSRRINTSSIPPKNENAVSFRLRQKPKEIIKIPLLPSESHD